MEGLKKPPSGWLDLLLFGLSFSLLLRGLAPIK